MDNEGEDDHCEDSGEVNISKVGPLHNWTSVLTMQCIPDQSHCQQNSVAQGGGHGHTAHWD